MRAKIQKWGNDDRHGLIDWGGGGGLMLATIETRGNGIGLPVPQAIAQCTHLRAGTEVELTIVNGKLVVTPVGSVEQRLDAIEARNTRVESDKKWETSWTRRISIAALTFAVVVVVSCLTAGKGPFPASNDPFIKGAGAVVGYLFSTIALPWIRSVWKLVVVQRPSESPEL